MITGHVTPNREARVPITVRGPGGREAAINPVLDTGFTGHLTLASRLIAELGLLEIDLAQTILADGTMIDVAVYEAIVLWGDQELVIPVEESEGGALIGMSLLWGSEVTFRAEENGPVTITPFA